MTVTSTTDINTTLEHIEKILDGTIQLAMRIAEARLAMEEDNNLNPEDFAYDLNASVEPIEVWTTGEGVPADDIYDLVTKIQTGVIDDARLLCDEIAAGDDEDDEDWS